MWAAVSPSGLAGFKVSGLRALGFRVWAWSRRWAYRVERNKALQGSDGAERVFVYKLCFMGLRFEVGRVLGLRLWCFKFLRTCNKNRVEVSCL